MQFGLASAVVRFVDFGLEMAHNVKDIYKSTTGVTVENENIELTIPRLHTLSGMLKQRWTTNDDLWSAERWHWAFGMKGITTANLNSQPIRID